MRAGFAEAWQPSNRNTLGVERPSSEQLLEFWGILGATLRSSNAPKCGSGRKCRLEGPSPSTPVRRLPTPAQAALSWSIAKRARGWGRGRRVGRQGLWLDGRVLQLLWGGGSSKGQLGPDPHLRALKKCTHNRIHGKTKLSEQFSERLSELVASQYILGRIRHAPNPLYHSCRLRAPPLPEAESALFQYRKPPLCVESPAISTKSPI